MWRETSGAAVVGTAQKPSTDKAAGERKGFGTVVLQRVTPQSLGGSSSLERSPGSLIWMLDAPLVAIVVPQLGAENASDFNE